MTTFADSISPPAAHAAPSLRPASDTAAPATSDSWLIAWTLNRAGLPAIVSVGHQPPAFPSAVRLTPARFALHLTTPLPRATIMRALAQFRAKRSPPALLLVAEAHAPVGTPYREHLHLNVDQQVLSIRRNFRKRRDRAPRPALLGVLWKLDPHAPNTLQSPLRGAAWRTVRNLLRNGSRPAPKIPRLLLNSADLLPPLAEFCPHFLHHLTPSALKALAADLNFDSLGEAHNFCFAHPSAVIDPQAILRGPLFIDPATAITADHIHIGPGWISPQSPPVTWPDHLEPAPAVHNYFTGPRVGPRPRYRAAKRLFDIAFSLLALAITFPVCLVVALLIKLYDRGPIFYAHTRESLHAKPFGCLKFRTMVKNAEALKKELRKQNEVDGPQFKIVKDPRITPLGRFLRKTNIDELPQFINVLMGDMSVVGPRPSPFEENQLCPAWREARLSVKPGITGLWQISRSQNRGAADFQEWILYDTQYVERQSFTLDMRILLLTIKELFGAGT